MSGRGRPKRTGRRPARLRAPSPSPPPARKRSRHSPPPARERSRQGEGSSTDQVQDRQGAPWWEDQSPPRAPSPPGNVENPVTDQDALLDRIRALEAALTQKQAANKGQELDELGITVPSDMRAKILAGKCVDLSQLLSKSLVDPQEAKQLCFIQDDQGRLVPKHERKSKTTLSIDQWTSAFHVYMSVYLKQHPDDLQGMLAYLELVRGAAKDTPGNAWAQYDQQFRSRKEADPMRPWGMIESQLWLQLFCHPLRDDQAGGSGIQQNRGYAKPAQTQRTPLCFHFNKVKGCQRNNCTYAHKCAECYSSGHAFPACPKAKCQKSDNRQPGGNETTTSNQSFRFGSGRKF